MKPQDSFAAAELGDCQRDRVVFLTEDGTVLRGYLYSASNEIAEVPAPETTTRDED